MNGHNETGLDLNVSIVLTSVYIAARIIILLPLVRSDQKTAPISTGRSTGGQDHQKSFPAHITRYNPDWQFQPLWISPPWSTTQSRISWILDQFHLPMEFLLSPIMVSAVDGGRLTTITHKTAPITFLVSGNHFEKSFFCPCFQSPHHSGFLLAHST